MKWNIVLDSSCDLLKTDKIFKNANLKLAPLTINVGDKEFIDDDNIDVEQLLTAMHREKRASSSACPSPETFLSNFEDADCSICITMTGALSGTNNSARLAKNMLQEEYPDKKIHIIDSHATGGVMVLLAKKADELIGKGLSFEEISKQLDEYNSHLGFVFSLMHFDNLIKTGRMKAFTGIVASHLGIRVIAKNTANGEIEVVDKVRGEHRTLHALVDFIASRKDLSGKPIVINHCNNLLAVEKLKEIIKEKCNTTDITVLNSKGITTFYSMDKGLLISY